MTNKTTSHLNATVGEINIICSDLQRSLRFYRDALGFRILEQEGVSCHMRCNQVHFLLLAIAQQPASSAPYGQVPQFSVDLLVDDLPAAVRHLTAHDVEFVSEWEANEKRVFIRDPDGLVFEVIQKE